MFNSLPRLEQLALSGNLGRPFGLNLSEGTENVDRLPKGY